MLHRYACSDTVLNSTAAAAVLSLRRVNTVDCFSAIFVGTAGGLRLGGRLEPLSPACNLLLYLTLSSKQLPQTIYSVLHIGGLHAA